MKKKSLVGWMFPGWRLYKDSDWGSIETTRICVRKKDVRVWDGKNYKMEKEKNPVKVKITIEEIK